MNGASICLVGRHPFQFLSNIFSPWEPESNYMETQIKTESFSLPLKLKPWPLYTSQVSLIQLYPQPVEKSLWIPEFTTL